MSKHCHGQYFTTNGTLQKKVSEFILNDPKVILEPSIGRGDLLKEVQISFPKATIDAFEIDNTLKSEFKVTYCDFLNQNISQKYDTIVSNPPYIRTKKGNLYVDFTEKCFDLLNDNGEMIFLVPSDFFKLTNAIPLIRRMMGSGTFTHIFHPNDEKLFENACIDVLIYRYQKGDMREKVTYNEEERFIVYENDFVSFEKEKYTKFIGDFFNCYVGIVSGADKVFKNEEFGNMSVLNGQNKREKFIYLKTFPTENEKINQYMLQHKDVLMNRKIKKFNEENWFEWGALRNLHLMEDTYKECIYIHNVSRKNNIAFKGNIGYFGGNLLMMVPKDDINLDDMVNYLNSECFKARFTYSGRFKIGQRQLLSIGFKFL